MRCASPVPKKKVLPVDANLSPTVAMHCSALRAAFDDYSNFRKGVPSASTRLMSDSVPGLMMEFRRQYIPDKVSTESVPAAAIHCAVPTVSLTQSLLRVGTVERREGRRRGGLG